MGPVYQEQTRLRAKNWLDQSQDAFIGILRERYSTHVFEGGQCHRVDARKREPWGQNLLKL